MEPLARTSLAETAIESIRADIVAGRWAVGEKLPNEASLCATLSVSRGTIREAVRVLAAQGYLETRQGSGTYVRSAIDTARALSMAHRASLRDRFEARCALDVEGARLAALRRTPAVIAELRRLLVLRGHSEAGMDRRAFVACDFAFHRAVIAASSNRAMVEIYEFFSNSIHETIEATLLADLPEPDMQAHVEIVDAIEIGDPDKADEAVRRFMAPLITALDRILLS
jgi:DNA-binding FadR family transcriptional regulator